MRRHHAAIWLMLVACRPVSAPSTTALEAPIFVTAAGDTVPMRETLRIGQLDGPDEYTFASILWTRPTSDGGVILYDLEGDDGYGEHGRIRQFDAGGAFVRYIGGPGEGPGEYGPLPMAVVLSTGHLVIADQGRARFTQYDTTGRVHASWPAPTGVVDLTVAANGGWYAASVTGHPSGKPRRVEFTQYDSRGREVAKIPAPPSYHEGPWGGIGAVDNPTSVVAILPDGRLVSARSDSLMLVVSSANGEMRVTAPHEPVAYLEEEAAARATMFKARAARSGGGAIPYQAPAFKQVFAHILTDQGGRILMRLRTQAYKAVSDIPLRPNQTPWREPFALEVFDSTLVHRGKLIAPRSTTRSGASFAPQAVWLVHEGEAGELYLVKWGAPRPIW